MNPAYEKLYGYLLRDLGKTMERDISENEKAECCFDIAIKYWTELKVKCRTDLTHGSEEVIFFREVKPKFLCHAEYFSLMRKALEGLPADKRAQREFWATESKSFLRFCEKHESFVAYYESEKRYMERGYFLRDNNIMADWITRKEYDCEPEFCSSRDHLVTSYLALNMYREYCKAKRAAVANILEPKIK